MNRSYRIVIGSLILLEGILFVILASSTWYDIVKGVSNFLTGKPIDWPIILHVGIWVCTLIFILVGLIYKLLKPDIQDPVISDTVGDEDDIDRKIRENLQKLSFLDRQ